jgi:hypothetical protein
VQIAGVIGAYSFSRFNLIGDIGGGQGHLLQAVLATNTRARGVLFDLPRASVVPTNAKPGQILFIARPFTFLERLLYPALQGISRQLSLNPGYTNRPLPRGF